MEIVTSWMETGRKQGERRGVLKVLLRFITSRFGKPDQDLEDRIRNLSDAELDNLSDIIFDFSDLSDLTLWLYQHEAVESK